MSIADKLNYLITTKGLLKDNINKINNVLDDNSTFRSYPQELFNGYLDVLNNGTDTLWNNLEKVSQTGTEAVLEGVETAPIKMVLNGNTAQNGEPTPDTPIPVQVVTGENVVSVSGKNLFDKSSNIVLNKYIGEDGTISGNSPRNWYQEDYIEVSNSTDYIISTTSSNYVRVAFYDDSKNFISRIVANGSIQISTTSSTKYLRLSGYENLNDNIQLEEGSTATPYVPYSKTDYPISLGTIEMCKIGDYQDYLYKNNGKWYVHKEINKVVLDGTENWPRTTAKDGHFRFRTFKYGNIADIKECYSDNFKYNGDTWSHEGINTVKSAIWIRNDELFTIESDLKTWLSTHNTIVYYILVTPTEEEITNTTLIEQLEAIFKAKSIKDKTYITQTNDDLPFILDVEAIKEYEVN